MRVALKLAGLAISLGLTVSAAQAAVSITVDKNNQKMTVAVDGVTKYVWPVSTGLPKYETPNGEFRAFRMEADHYSKEWDDAPMPHSIFFTKQGHAIHGTDHAIGIGNPASHGCVRLSRANAATLYALVEDQGVLNTTVTLTGSSTVALARRKNVDVASAPKDDGVRATSGDADNYTVQAPRQIVPPGARQATADDSEEYYAIDQWGRTVMVRRPRTDQRAANTAPNYYDSQPQYYGNYGGQTYGGPAYGGQSYGAQSYGYRNPYYAPRRGLFADGW